MKANWSKSARSCNRIVWVEHRAPVVLMRRSLPVFLLLAATISGRGAAQASGATALLNVFPQSQEHPVTATDPRPVPLTADALQGPPNAATMSGLTSMSDEQLAQYLAAYRAHMAATWQSRVATMSALRMMNRAYQNSDAYMERFYNLVLDRLWSRLRGQDEAFDLAIAAILSKKQLTSYRAWKATWEQAARLQQQLDVTVVEISVPAR